MNFFNLYGHNETVFKGKKPEKVAYIKAHIASRILSGMGKETPLLEETLTLSSEGDVEERTVGSETSLTLLGELTNISDNPIQWSHQCQGKTKREHGSSETVTYHGRTRRKKKCRKSG